MFLSFAAGTFLLVAAVGIAALVLRGNGLAIVQERERTAANSGAAAVNPAPGESSSAAPSAGGGGVAAPTASAATTATAPAAGAGEAPSQPSAESAGAQAAASKEAPNKEAAPVKEPRAAPAVPKEPAAAPQPAAPSYAEFNMGETRARLASIAAGVQSCKRGDTTGSGRVEIVFGPSGAAQSASLQAGSPFDGTPTGKCVEARFRQARIPAFGGSPVPVTKSFSIN